MAVYKETFDSPERVVHLAPDGVWQSAQLSSFQFGLIIGD